jgi:hypothetical protein
VLSTFGCRVLGAFGFNVLARSETARAGTLQRQVQSTLQPSATSTLLFLVSTLR